jgi:hypothetical protein
MDSSLAGEASEESHNPGASLPGADQRTVWALGAAGGAEHEEPPSHADEEYGEVRVPGEREGATTRRVPEPVQLLGREPTVVDAGLAWIQRSHPLGRWLGRARTVRPPREWGSGGGRPGNSKTPELFTNRKVHGVWVRHSVAFQQTTLPDR